MKKIVNWTFGSVFRTFGRVFAYILIGVLFSFIMAKSGLKITDLIGIDTIKAAEVNTNYEKYSVRMYSTETLTEQWSSFMDTGSNFTTQDSDLYLRAFRVRYGSNDKFLKGKTYRVKVNVLLNNGNSSRYKNVNNVVCYGSQTNSFDMNTGFIDTCQFIAKTLYEDNTRAHYYFDIKPNTDLYSIQVQFYYSDSSMYQLNMTSVSPLQVGTGTNATYDDSDITAINNQTTDIINNNNYNTEQIINNQNEMLGNCVENIMPTNNILSNSLGLTYRINQDKSITVSGTATSSGFFQYYTIPNANTITSESDIFGSMETKCTDKGYCINMPQDGGLTISNGVLWSYINSGQTYNFTYYPMLYKGSKTNTYTPPGTKKCTSKLDDTNNAINNLNDTINDSSSPSLSGLSNSTVAGWLPAGPVDSILNLPLTLINSLINGMSGSCAPLRVPLPYVNLELPIPCMSTVYTQMGFGTFFNWVGNIAAAFILFKYLLKLYKYVDDTLTFRENNFIDNWSGV